MAEIMADDVEVERCSHDNSAVATENSDEVVRAKMKATEQIVEIAEADRTRDHALKTAVVAGDAAAQYDRIGTAMQHRTADEQADVRPVDVRLEILLVAAIVRCRIEARRIDGQLALRVEHLDRAEMLGGGGMVEQDQMPDLPADVLDLRHHEIAGDGAQRQVVQLDIAVDVGVN